ncbi:hypothetical protein PQ610_06660 [Tardisphaera miroshnichenkoae]
MKLRDVIAASAAYGFGGELQSQVESALADLYAADEIPESWAEKGLSPRTGQAPSWPYAQEVRELLVSLGLVETPAVYGRGDAELNWHFLALAEPGLDAAREAYAKRLQENSALIADVARRFYYLLPFVMNGAEDPRKFCRAEEAGSLGIKNFTGCYVWRAEHLSHVLLAKLDARMPAPERPGRFSLPAMWESLKPRYAAEPLDLDAAFFQAVVNTEAFAQEARELFSPLKEMRVALELPDHNTSRVYSDCSYWAFPEELFADFSSPASRYQPAKGLMTRFLSLVLFWLAADAWRWKPEVIKGAASLLAYEGDRHDLSAEELVAGFQALASVEGSKGVTSMPNLGVEEAPVLIVRNSNALETDLQRELEGLAREAISDAEAGGGGFPSSNGLRENHVKVGEQALRLFRLLAFFLSSAKTCLEALSKARCV